jgi:hypothetical protein
MILPSPIVREKSYIYNIVLMLRLLDRVVENDLINFLYKSSWFKSAQLDSLLCRKYCKENGMNVGEAIKFRDKLVSFGSFDRSCRQGMIVIKRSLITILFAAMLELIDQNSISDLERLLRILKELAGNSDDNLRKEAITLIRDYVNDMI